MAKTDALSFQKRFPSYNMSPQSTYAKGILFLSVIAGLGMAYLIFMHWADPAWFLFFVMEGSFCYVAIPGIIALDYYGRIRGLVGISKSWKWQNTATHFVLILIVVLVVQKMFTQLGAVLSVNQMELFFYYVFGAICEELFFRGLVFRGILGYKNNLIRLILGMVVSTAGFIVIHQSYWNNPLKLVIVGASGAILCLFYWFWKDLLANVTAHAFINLIVAFTLVAMPTSIGTCVIILIVTYTLMASSVFVGICIQRSKKQKIGEKNE